MYLSTQARLSQEKEYNKTNTNMKISQKRTNYSIFKNIKIIEGKVTYVFTYIETWQPLEQ